MIDAFKADIVRLSDTELINKYYVSGSAFALVEDLHFSLRQRIADFFSIDYTNVFIVGSAKLGFSIKPDRRFQAFSDNSDIDVVIINTGLFEEVWKEVFQFERGGGFWGKMPDFKKYHYQGWIRPDKLPTTPAFNLTKKWWEFFESLSGSGAYGPYQIRGGLYYSNFFFQKYQQKCFDQCRNEVTV